ncbi:hypothetical protein F9L16_23860 [Agarivorans sp. B2Z047]|uniref:LamG-like jellyroll fold domain-containing protein n=1 Tax=Agarivorans sp. B2Z047 TaxID=2652721 RepID=UPI00128C5444|nr:LamG-like jellyroll fold domain-containing protein [Agarivorans sp. B2Z047]MPW31986.1 hypothetical protein [Agarivorans sp. B2Z047]UQN40969.1 hypothetical protein LQZ07_14425 [Agarivorans sp. B2Z047]UQN43712.1 hypothetical protein LQZ07_04375 [Agarivorans sp. B2Z047]
MHKGLRVLLSGFVVLGVFSCGDSSETASIALENDLALYLPMEGISGGRVEDLSPYGRHADVIGESLSFEEGVSGNAISIKDSSAYLKSNFSGWETEAFTVSFWLKPKTFENYNNNIGAGWGQFAFHLNKGGSYYTGTSSATKILPGKIPNEARLTLDAWSHIAVTYYDEGVSVYFNGEFVIDQTVEVPNSWTDFFVGNAKLTSNINGLVDELRVYERQLDASEIKWLFDNPGGAPPNNGEGTVSITFPSAPESSANAVITGQLYANGRYHPFTGRWGETVEVTGLESGLYQLTVNSPHEFMPRFMPQLLNLEDSNSVAVSVEFRDALPLEQISTLAGMSLEIFNDGIFQPRQMVEGDGVIYVGSSAIPIDSDPSAGMIYAIPLDAHEAKYIVASGMEEPHGVAYRDGVLYYSTVGGIYKIDNIDENYKHLPEPVKIYTYPADGSTFPLEDDFRSWHQKHPIKFNSFDKDDDALYTAIGIPCNVCVTPDERYGTLLKIDLDTQEETILARGIRNSVGFDWHPVTGKIWFTDNNRQGMINPDEINWVDAEGEHFGAPYVFGRDTIGILESEVEDGPLSPIPPGSVLTDIPLEDINPQDYRAPAFEVESNSAPLGIHFSPIFPTSIESNSQLLYATHGNGHRDIRPALEVRMITVNEFNQVLHERPLATGWMQNIDEVEDYTCLTDACIGRPMELLTLSDGSVLVSDDKADVIYQLSYDDNDIGSTSLTLLAPSIPDDSLRETMMSGELIDSNGIIWPIYLSWESPDLVFYGLEDGSYTLKLNRLANWQPQPATQSVSVGGSHGSASLTWDYQQDEGSGAFVFQAPSKPEQIDSEQVKVTLQTESRFNNSTYTSYQEEVLLNWGEVKTVEAPFGDYKLTFGYQYGGIPEPLTEDLSLTSQEPSHTVTWAFDVHDNVGDTMLNGPCSSCHGQNSEGLGTEDVANKWFDNGFEALKGYIEGMPLHCDDVCSDQVGIELWTNRWLEFDPPPLDDPKEGDVPVASITEATVDVTVIDLAWLYKEGMEGVTNQQVQLRYNDLKWLKVEDVDLEQFSLTFSAEYGGEIDLRIASFNDDNEVAYSDIVTVEVTTLPAKDVSTEGLILHWSFDTPDYLILTDDSHNDRDGNVSEMIFRQEGGPSDSFGGVDSQLVSDFGEAVELDKGFTVSYWIYPHSSHLHNQYKLGEDDWGSFFAQGRNESQMIIGVTGSGSRFETEVGTFILNEWQHFVYRREADGEATLYRNGVAIESGTHRATPEPLTSFQFFRTEADLDEVRVYTRALSHSEILALYTTPAVGKMPEKAIEPPPDLPPGEIGGEGLWDMHNCSSCHGDDGNGQVPILSALSRDDIEEYIARTMPPANINGCDIECSNVMTEWMRDTFLDPDLPPTEPPPASDSALNVEVPDDRAGRFFYKVALNIANRLPTEEEKALIDEEGAKVLNSLVDDLVNSEYFSTRIMTIYDDALHFVGLPSPHVMSRNFSSTHGFSDRGDRDWYALAEPSGPLQNYLRDQTKEAIAQEAGRLIKHVVDNNLPFTEILTADYTVINYFSAEQYAVAGSMEFNRLDYPEYDEYPWDPEDYKVFRFGIEHTGVLSTVSFMGYFPTTSTNVNRQRSTEFYKLFVDTDIMGFGGDRPTDEDLAGENPTLENPACTGCHIVMDPVASAFKHWTKDPSDSRGPVYSQVVTPDLWDSSGILPVGFNGEEAPYYTEQPLRWLVERVVEDPRFARSVVKVLFEGITGHPLHPPLSKNEEETQVQHYYRQQMDIETLSKSFVNSGFDIRELAKELIFSEYTLGTDKVGGSSRLLSPDDLNRKAEVVLGKPWSRREDYQWLKWSDQKFATLYGGVDHYEVLTPLHNLNGIGATVQNQFAHDMACQAVPLDFFRAPERRFMFEMIEPNLVLTTALRFDASLAELSGEASLASGRENEYGEGYIVQSNTSGEASRVDWNVSVGAEQEFHLFINYSNQNNERKMVLLVNGEVVAPSLDFPITDSWNAWRQTALVKVSLNEGDNTVSLVNDEDTRAPHIDYLGLYPISESSLLTPRNMQPQAARTEVESLVKQVISDMYYGLYGVPAHAYSNEVQRAYDVYLYALENLSSDNNVDSECRPGQFQGMLDYEDRDDVEKPYLKVDREHYTRAWMAVLTYLLRDQRFYYH